MPSRTTMPAGYVTLNSQAADDGRPLNTHVRVTCAQNLNRVWGAGRRLVNDLHPVAGDNTFRIGSCGEWTLAGLYPVRPTAGINGIRWALWGKVTNTSTLYAMVTPPLERIDPESPDVAQTFVGDGTFKRYPAAPAFVTARPGYQDALNLWVRGLDMGAYDAAKAGGPDTYAGYEEIQDDGSSIYLRSVVTGPGGGTIGFSSRIGLTGQPSNVFVGIKQVGTDTDWLLPPARVLRALSDTEILIARGWDLAVANLPRVSAAHQPAWQLREPTELTLGCLAVYEDRPTGVYL